MLEPPPQNNPSSDSQSSDLGSNQGDSGNSGSNRANTAQESTSASSDLSQSSTSGDSVPSSTGSNGFPNPFHNSNESASDLLIRALESINGPLFLSGFPMPPQPAFTNPQAAEANQESTDNDRPSAFHANLLDLLITRSLAGSQRAEGEDLPAAPAANPDTNGSSGSAAAGAAPEPTTAPGTPLGPGEDIGAIIITINYAFANDASPNRTGLLTISVPNTSSNRNPQTIHDFVSLATRIAYEELFSVAKTGITEEKFESFEIVPIDELTDRICSICFEPYEGLQPLEKMAESIALKRRKLSPDEHSISLSESEDRDERDERTRLRPSTPSAFNPSTNSNGNTTETNATDGAAPDRASGPTYLCDQDKEFSHEAIKFPCGHIFGKSCLAHWLKTATTCPLCRFNVNTPNNDGTGNEDGTNSPAEPRRNIFHLFSGNWLRPNAFQGPEGQQPRTESQSQSSAQPQDEQAPVAPSVGDERQREQTPNTPFQERILRQETPSRVSPIATPHLFGVPSSLTDSLPAGTHGEVASRAARRFERSLNLLRRTTQSIRHLRGQDVPPAPLIPTGAQRNAPSSLRNLQEHMDSSNELPMSRGTSQRNPSFAPLIEGITNFFGRNSQMRNRDTEGGETSIFSSGVSSRRTPNGIETTSSDTVTPPANTTPSSVIIISPNFFMSRLNQHDDAPSTTAREDQTDSAANDDEPNLHSGNDTP